jgi:LysM repeat protein
VKRSIYWFILALLVAGCAANPTPAPTAPVPTQTSTWTPQPTHTPRPTYTPNPTLTPYPTPTYLPPTPTPAPTAMPTPVTYVVQPGDWLTIVAQRFNLSQESIIAANNIADPNHIEVGTVLIIPVTPTLSLTGTVAITPTARPVVARPVAPAAPPAPSSQFIYPAPRILYPDNGLTLKYSAKEKNDGTDSITFAWLPAGQLQSGTQPCTWEGQPNGADGWIWDRYHIELDPPLYSDKLNRSLNVFHNDQGTAREFSLLEFKSDVSYTWRVVVGRWCVSRNHDNQDPRHQGLLGLVSPYSESRTFRYSP